MKLPARSSRLPSGPLAKPNRFGTERRRAEAERLEPDIVVMDLGLPDGDALDVIRRIKAEDDDIIVVAFSGWPHLEASARAAGADAFVSGSSVPRGHGCRARSMAPRVLVVEDDADGRDPLAEVLRLQGYAVTSAADGASAIGRLGTDEIDVVVLDLGLPDVVGIDVIRAARALPDGGPAVVVFTGHHRLRADAEAAGCAAFILKPDLDGLLAQLGTIIAAATNQGRKVRG